MVRRFFRSIRQSKKPPWIFAIRDRIAYQALLTSRLAAILSFIAVCLNAVVAYVAITSLKLNSTTADQARNTSQTQIDLNRQLANAATRQAEASIEAAKTSRDSLSAAQRAWIGPRTAGSDVKPEIDKSLKLNIQYQNTGREPALETVYDTDIFIADGDQEKTGQKVRAFQDKCKLKWTPGQTTVVFPSVGNASSYQMTKPLDNCKLEFLWNWKRCGLSVDATSAICSLRSSSVRSARCRLTPTRREKCQSKLAYRRKSCGERSKRIKAALPRQHLRLLAQRSHDVVIFFKPILCEFRWRRGRRDRGRDPQPGSDKGKDGGYYL